MELRPILCSPSFRPSAARAGIQPALAAPTCISCKDALDSRFRGNDSQWLCGPALRTALVRPEQPPRRPEANSLFPKQLSFYDEPPGFRPLHFPLHDELGVEPHKHPGNPKLAAGEAHDEGESRGSVAGVSLLGLCRGWRPGLFGIFVLAVTYFDGDPAADSHVSCPRRRASRPAWLSFCKSRNPGFPPRLTIRRGNVLSRE